MTRPSRLLAPVPADRRGRRGAQLLTGLVLYGVTSAMMVLSGLGLDPWDVLHQGLSRTFGLGIGTWAIIVSFFVLLGWIPLRQRPGVGTATNVVLVGAVIDLMLVVFHPPHAVWARIALLLGAVAGNGLATGLYIGAQLGPGARDGLTTGIAARGHSIRIVRTTIEAAVLVTGFVLGGTVGIGTLLYALAIGPITHVTIPALAITRGGRTPWATAPGQPAAGHDAAVAGEPAGHGAAVAGEPAVAPEAGGLSPAGSGRSGSG
ncbi:MAG TPA: hypothetical protein VHX62_05680 [Solirubrobacteraceae bacterium]|nr:hypothetical protein [Solirubrobacteraceae bacterium]